MRNCRILTLLFALFSLSVPNVVARINIRSPFLRLKQSYLLKTQTLRAHFGLRTLKRTPQGLQDAFRKQALLVHPDRAPYLTPLQRFSCRFPQRTFPQLKESHHFLQTYYASRLSRPTVRSVFMQQLQRARALAPRMLIGTIGASLSISALCRQFTHSANRPPGLVLFFNQKMPAAPVSQG
jgi:hypothetical protein